MNGIKVVEDFQPLFDEEHKNYKTRFHVYYGGRGSGKSTSVAMGLLIRGMKQKEKILCTRELQNSIQDSVLQTLADEIDRLGIRDFYEVQANAIYGANGTEFLFKGLKNNIQSIKSIPNITICWIEEAQTVSHQSYEVLIPTVRAEGSQIIITFNPNNPTDPTFERFVKTASEDIYCRKVNFDKNPFFPDVLKKEAEKLKRDDEAAYNHVYLGEFDTRRTGVVYAKQMLKASEDGRITRCPYDPASEVFTAWDLGFGDSTAIWWLQFVGRELRWLEYYENSGEQLDHYAKIIKSKTYNYSTHYLPHDGAAGNIRGLKPSAQLTALGLKNVVMPSEPISVGIERLRQTLAFSVFDSRSCRDGLHALNNYHYEWSETLNRFKDSPCHDAHSNGADAARYAAQAAARIKNTQTVLQKPRIPVAHFHSGSGWMG